MRTVEWVRDHGGSPVVDAVENWYYARQAPSAVGAPQDQLSGASPTPSRGTAATAATTAPPFAPVVRRLAGTRGLPGEGVWRPLGVDHLLWQTWLRPDPQHLPVVAAAVLVPAGAVALHLAPGTREPVTGMASATQAQVPPAQRSRLEAVFNAGFKMRDSHGGWQLGSRAAVPLQAGRASLVIDRAGQWRIGAWGQDVSMTPDVAAVRQNLDLVVVGGHAVHGLDSNANGSWGTAHTQFQFTWRSGIGVDSHGDLIYVAGRSMTLATFAQAMARLGVQQGMQLDIHPAMVSFNAVQQRHGRQLVMRRLLSSMASSPRRYLTADQRDFFYLTAPGAS